VNFLRHLCWLCVVSLAALTTAAQALTHLELAVTLDPAARSFSATAQLSDAAGISGFSLASAFELTALESDGQAVTPVFSTRQGQRWYRLPAASRALRVSYRAELQALQALDHRQVLGMRAAVADTTGSFLPAASGWYPDPGAPFSYRLSVQLPPGQKGLVAGTLLDETSDQRGYRARFDFPYPADGIDLMAGPYQVSERLITLPGQVGKPQPTRLRTWFHPELAADKQLVTGYLDDSARYLQRYSALIGTYPFASFSIVSSPTPTGFGMPSLTYLGREVIKLPFIRASSLGHEVLHNWWGNGVYPDWDSGNWSEGLTTFLADYAYQEDRNPAAAQAMRLGWLRDLAAVPPAEDIPLKDFVARRHGISSIIGYNKAAMLFLMLRDQIGTAAFNQGLQRLWQHKQFQTAAWSDLEAAFSAAAGHSLQPFFQQWVQRAGAPRLALAAAWQEGHWLRLRLDEPSQYALTLQIRLNFKTQSQLQQVKLRGDETTLRIDLSRLPTAQEPLVSVELDPELRLWRRLASASLPPILREVLIAPRVQALLVEPKARPDWQVAAQTLTQRLLDAPPPVQSASRAKPDHSTPLLIMGSPVAVNEWLAYAGLPPRPPALPQGSAQVWAGRDVQQRPYLAVTAENPDALAALARPLPHYGKQSWLVFADGRVSDKGIWPLQTVVVPVAEHALPSRTAVPPAPTFPQ
jgi:hypothetical protein